MWNKHIVRGLAMVGSMFVLSFFISIPNAHAAVRTASVSGNWSNPVTWGGLALPATGDDVIINSGINVTLNITSTPVLNTVTINAMGVAGTHTLTIGTNTLNTGTLTIGGSPNNGRDSIVTISTGTINVTGNIAISGTAAQTTITFTGAGTINIGGNFAEVGTFTAGSGTVNFNGSGAQSVGGFSYYNLTFSGSNTSTALNAVTVTNNLIINSGIFTTDGDLTQTGGTMTVNNSGKYTETGGTQAFAALTINNGGTVEMFRPLTVSGVTTISGAIRFGSTSGTSRLMTFTGNVTLNSGAEWAEPASGNGANNTYNFAGNFTNNATIFNALGTGVHTFSGAAKILSGSTDIVIPSTSFTGNTTNNGVFRCITSTITGVTLTNNGTTTVSSSLSGTGGLTQGVTGVLNIGGTAGITTLTATAAGNVVNYTDGVQTVKATTYYNLILSGSGNKTLTGSTVNNLLSMQGTATAAGTSPTFGAAATLEYKGSAAQTTSNVEFPATWTGSGGVRIENANGVTLNAAKSIDGRPLTIGSVVSNSVFNDGGYQLFATGTLNLVSGTFKLGSASTATRFPTTSVNNIASGTTVEFASNQPQTITTSPAYYNLTFSGNGAKTTQSGNVIVGGDWSITGGTATLNTNNTNVTVTGSISGTGAITSGSGTISLKGNWTNSGTFTPGTGTVIYNTASGGQHIAGNTYNNLTLANTASWNFADGTTTVNNILTTTAGGILNMTTYPLAGTLATISNNGTIRTQNTSALPIPSGKTWGGTILYDAASGQVIVTGTYNNLTIDQVGNNTSIGGDINVSSTLSISNSVVSTSVYTVYINTAGGSLSRGSGYIDGNLRKYITTGATSKTFEVGNPVGRYSPIDISFGNVTATGTLTVKTVTGEHPNIASSSVNPSKSVNRYWTMTSSSALAFNNYSAIFNYISGEVDGGADTSNFIVGKYSGGTWTYPTVGTKNATNTAVSGLTSFSDFAIGESSSDPAADAVAADKAALATSSILGANPDEFNITVALTNPLPSVGTASGSAITWLSNSTTLISNDGQTVNRPAFSVGDQVVNMTATIVSSTASTTKVFPLTVLKVPASTDARITSTVYTVGANTITNVPFGTAKATVLGNLNMVDPLASWDASGVSDPVVTGDVLVGIAEDTVTNIIYAITTGPDYAGAVAADKAALATSSILGANPDEFNITVALTNPLPSVGTASGSAITWLSNSTTLISNDGQTVNRPAFSVGDKVVNMTATIASGTASTTKVFPLTVKAMPANTDARITSTVYTVGANTITNVPFGTAKATVLGNLNMVDPLASWDASGVSDPVVTGDVLVGIAEDTVTNIVYTITTGLDYAGAVAADKAALTDTVIKNLNTDLSHVTTSLSLITTGTASSSNIFWTSDNPTYVATSGVVSRPLYAVGDVVVHITSTISSSTASDTKTFTVTVLRLPASTVSTISSGVYTVGANTITNVPFNEAKATFLSNLTKDDPLEVWTITSISDPVVTGDTMTSTAEDASFTVYTVTVIAPSSDAVIISGVYTVGANTIINIPYNTSKATFLGNLAKHESHQTWDSSGIADPVVTGNIITSTAQDGTTKIAYAVTVNAQPANEPIVYGVAIPVTVRPNTAPSESMSESCPALVAGDMVKVVGKPAIYVLNINYETLYFPSGDVFKSWRPTYGGYKSISQTCFDVLKTPAFYPGAINYRYGSYVIKRASSNQLYAVEPNNSVAKISPAVALALYGTGYKVMAIEDYLWPNYYNRGIAIDGAVAHPGMLVKVSGIIYYVGLDSILHEVTANGMTANGFQDRFVHTLSSAAIKGMAIGDKIDKAVPALTDKTQSSW